MGEFCERHDLTVVSDEIHSDLILDEGLRHISMLALDDGVRACARAHCICCCVVFLCIGTRRNAAVLISNGPQLCSKGPQHWIQGNCLAPCRACITATSLLSCASSKAAARHLEMDLRVRVLGCGFARP